MIPTEEQKNWLWEQCGFRFDKEFPITPQGSVWWTPPVDIDLNNLAEYGMPEGWQQIIFQPDGYCGITVNDNLFEAEGDTPADAMFGAIYKALGGKE